ncbi:hypothetical protein EDB84DRAFT_1444896 [Lactarius hengduanensis]|nr:hypothetical protein EDB84DRAFT_1444896 [Lactarius hengduanensis]
MGGIVGARHVMSRVNETKWVARNEGGWYGAAQVDGGEMEVMANTTPKVAQDWMGALAFHLVDLPESEHPLNHDTQDLFNLGSKEMNKAEEIRNPHPLSCVGGLVQYIAYIPIILHNFYSLSFMWIVVLVWPKCGGT